MENPEEVITPHQLELIALYASGHQLAEIGEMKFLTTFAVRNALSRARERVGAKSLAHLCVMCMDHGMIQKNGRGYKPVQVERVVAE